MLLPEGLGLEGVELQLQLLVLLAQALGLGRLGVDDDLLLGDDRLQPLLVLQHVGLELGQLASYLCQLVVFLHSDLKRVL